LDTLCPPGANFNIRLRPKVEGSSSLFPMAANDGKR
jgi:hypothetical protein